MAGISLSTAGILFGYGVETSKGVKPSSFTQIERAMSLPSLNPQPESLDVTPLDATEWKEYIAGMKDIGGALAVRFSLNNSLKETWGKFVEDYNTAKESDLKTWVEFYIPGMTDAFFFTCEPTPLGFGGAEVNAHLEVEAFITPTGNIGWATAIKPVAPEA